MLDDPAVSELSLGGALPPTCGKGCSLVCAYVNTSMTVAGVTPRHTSVAARGVSGTSQDNPVAVYTTTVLYSVAPLF